jgi:tetratricopeptide (TPR) repeat protein
MSVWLGVFWAVLPTGVAARTQDAAADPAVEAHRLWQGGKYDEALEAYEALAKTLKPDDAAGRSKVALGRAEALISLGRYEDAAASLVPLVPGEGPVDVDAAARLAALRFDQGRWEESEALVERVLEANPDQLLARWTRIRTDLARGNRERAVEAAKWFIDHHNAHEQELDRRPGDLLLIGQAAELFYRSSARGEELAEALNDVINNLYERAIQADPKCWQAAWLQGRLFLSGYEEPSALKELQRALRLNPSAAEVHVTLGQADLQGYKLASGRRRVETALEINPHYAPAHILEADLNISDERFEDAKRAAEAALAENPRDEEALARLAAACRLLVDPVGAAEAETRALARNPQPAAFYAALGERLADRRKYHSAERALLLAIAADPQAAAPRIGLGMLYMQIGREAEASDLFEAAFAADPFNVRANNMRKVLAHLAGYETVETEHFVVKTPPGADVLVARYMAEYLEEVYTLLSEKFQFAPPGKTIVELMKDHQWFSGRTIALPFIPTVGACTGKIVALASPRSTNKPYNWSRVLVHEMTHVWNLQQSDFNIPHWYTEALAVESEQTPRPQEWNKMLVERVPKRKLLNLENINLGFIRPREPEERQLAYCQAQLYAQYIVKRFGPDALIKLLMAYREGLTTPAAIPHCFGVTVADFEAKYLEHLDSVVKQLRTRAETEPETSFSELERQLAEKPEDADLNARMAYEHFARRDLKAARPLADKALELRKHHPLASYVKARLLSSIGDDSGALALLEPALDPEAPDERVLDLLAELLMKAERLDEAEELYRKAIEADPLNSKWVAGIARVHVRKGDRVKLREALGQLAMNDADNLILRKRLAQEHLAAQDLAQAEKWARECIYIQVDDPTTHAMLAEALAGQNKHEPAVAEWRTALGLKPKNALELEIQLARSLKALGRVAEAREVLDKVLSVEPENGEAKALRAGLPER